MNDFREASFMSYQNSESEIQKLALNSSLVLLSESDEDSNEEFRYVYKKQRIRSSGLQELSVTGRRREVREFHER